MPIIADKKKGKNWKLIILLMQRVSWVKWTKYDKDEQWYLTTNFHYIKKIVNDFYNWHFTKLYATIAKVASNSNWKTQVKFKIGKHQSKLIKKLLSRAFEGKKIINSKEIKQLNQLLTSQQSWKKIEITKVIQ